MKELLLNFKEELDFIKKYAKASKAEKKLMLENLLNVMATTYNIPLTYDKKYANKNKEVINIFESIVNEIRKLDN
ncbi:hypothetical protein FKN04_12660 [Bacillus glycinifermentans]|uniref:hypothetical protein n=1 Tax=Bacillus glycinifermentans TaxID=1664069 RepID=UPI0015814618|nr:hypothetical protein [Bacillus glycinifermentans]NUJ17427.1 hypothetical protein [Bacillus glycinifermentans]